MNKATLAIAVLVAVWVPTRASATDCKIGTQQALTGQMAGAVETADGEWFSSIIENIQPCIVDKLKGKGKVPAGCGFGDHSWLRKFTATGQVQMEGLGPVLIVTSIRCSP